MNKPVLILYDFSHLIASGMISAKRLDALYRHLILLSKHTIVINDRDFGDLSTVFKNSTAVLDIQYTHLPLERIDYHSYEMVLCNAYIAKECIAVLQQNYTKQQYQHVPIYSLDPSSDGKSTPLKYFLEQDPSSQLDKTLTSPHWGIQNYDQEDGFKKAINTIVMVNQQKDHTQIKNILILDDYLRDFFIGDTYLWYTRIRELISQFSYKKVVVNCINRVRFQRILQIFGDTFSKNTTFEANSWKTIPFDHFDLVICHVDLIFKFLSFIKQRRIVTPNFLQNTFIYRFSPNAISYEINDKYHWDIQLLLDRIKEKRAPFQHLKMMRKKTHKELLISEDERNWGNTWLEKNGYVSGNTLWILIDEASKSNKVLRRETTINLIKNIIKIKHTQLLLFDYLPKDKKQQLQKFFTPQERKKILIAEKLNIRQEMCILSSKYVKGIIGPCTGLMHLANGIYTHLKNKHIIKKEQLPLLLVYTGSGFDPHHYHPIFWWNNSLVTCIVPVKQDEMITSIKLAKAPMEISVFQKKCLSVNHISEKMIMPYIHQKIQAQSYENSTKFLV